MTTMLDHAYITAWKQHQCNLCRQAINTGERYNCQTIIWEGAIEKVRSHLYCDAVLNQHWQAWCHQDGYGPDDFDEDMSEAWGGACDSASRGIAYPWLTNGWTK